MKKEIIICKTGKLFDVAEFPRSDGLYTVIVNPAIAEYVGFNAKEFESYLRKSFRHFYNLDKKLKPVKRKGRLKINSPKI